MLNDAAASSACAVQEEEWQLLIIRGHLQMTSTNFRDFVGSPRPDVNFGLIYSSIFNTTSYTPILVYPATPLSQDVICTWPLIKLM